MITPGAGVRVYLACGVTDMRKGITGLAAQAQEVLKRKPASGAVFCYRGRRGDRLKLLFRDGQGFCLYCKALEKGGFPWPSSADGTALRTRSLSHRSRALTGASEISAATGHHILTRQAGRPVGQQKSRQQSNLLG